MRSNRSENKRQLHSLARLDGDNADGNPATLGLLDEAVRTLEGAYEAIWKDSVRRANEMDQYEAVCIGSALAALHCQIEKLKQQAAQIESQANTGASRDG